jgi:hypothetical protein
MDGGRIIEVRMAERHRRACAWAGVGFAPLFLIGFGLVAGFIPAGGGFISMTWLRLRASRCVEANLASVAPATAQFAPLT